MTAGTKTDFAKATYPMKTAIETTRPRLPRLSSLDDNADGNTRSKSTGRPTMDEAAKTMANDELINAAMQVMATHTATISKPQRSVR